MKRILRLIRREPTLCAAMLAAGVSCLFVPPDEGYAGYLDFRTLALLYSLMVVVAGLRGAGAFDALARLLCKKARTVRALGLLLVALCFFGSMLITNDVALLTFVPFAVTVLELCGEGKHLAYIVVLQTIGANLGSMLTPVGNPQNLYLYSYYAMRPGAFFSATGPVWAVSGVLIGLLCLLLPAVPLNAGLEDGPAWDKRSLFVYLGLFLWTLPVVFRALPWPWMLGGLLLVLCIYRPKALLKADFLLLATFLCFFVFAGNLTRMDGVNRLLRSLLSGRELLVGAGVSQLISNVPAAILLSGFTGAARPLLLGVNIGGLGTPIASLASLIGMKLYAGGAGTEKGRFLPLFLLLNFGLLALLLPLGALLCR